MGWEFPDRVKHLPRVQRPESFHTFVSRSKDGEPCYGQTAETPYGEPLECVRAHDLIPALETIAEPEWFRLHAAINYLRALPPDTKIALYWH